MSHPPQEPSQTPSEKEDELRRIRRLKLMVGMVRAVLSQDRDLTPAKAEQMILECRSAALALFPGKDLAFDLIYRPRLERVVRERFGT